MATEFMTTTETTPAVLCYVEGNWAYFTTRPLADQWGDDWNDAPYEHNAGEPYAFHEHDKKDGKKSWEIIKVAWDGDFVTPCSGLCNSPWSVEQINAGAVAWLRSDSWSGETKVYIPAGTTLEQFEELIRKGGGQIFRSTP